MTSGAVEDSGWLAGVRRVASPNCDERPLDGDVDLIVIHAISLPPGEFGGHYVERLFTNTLDPDAHPYFATIADLRVSAHLYVDRGGTVTQFVALDKRAWHAGESCWGDRNACNDFSVGIELEGCDEQPFEDIQYEQLNDLIARIRQRWPHIDDTCLAGHSDIAPGRKTDPGPCFDWSRVQGDAPA